MSVDVELARLPAAEVAPGTAVRVLVPGGAVCVVRLGDDFYAVGDRCSHANVSLSEGEINPDGPTIECWKHGSAFSLVDGQPQSLPATRPVAVYRVDLDGDQLVVRGQA